MTLIIMGFIEIHNNNNNNNKKKTTRYGRIITIMNENVYRVYYE